MVCLGCLRACSPAEILSGTGWIKINNVQLAPWDEPALLDPKRQHMLVNTRWVPLRPAKEQLIERGCLTRFERELFFFYCEDCAHRFRQVNPDGLTSVSAGSITPGNLVTPPAGPGRYEPYTRIPP